MITPLLFLAAILAAPKPADVAKPAAAADGWDKAFEISKVEVPAGQFTLDAAEKVFKTL